MSKIIKIAPIAVTLPRLLLRIKGTITGNRPHYNYSFLKNHLLYLNSRFLRRPIAHEAIPSTMAEDWESDHYEVTARANQDSLESGFYGVQSKYIGFLALFTAYRLNDKRDWMFGLYKGSEVATPELSFLFLTFLWLGIESYVQHTRIRWHLSGDYYAM